MNLCETPTLILALSFALYVFASFLGALMFCALIYMCNQFNDWRLSAKEAGRG